MGSTILEEGGALAGALVTGDEAPVCLAVVVVNDAISAVHGVEVRASDRAIRGGDVLDKVLVSLDHLGSERPDNLLNRSLPLGAFVEGLFREHGSGQVEEVSSRSLEGKEDYHSKEVEHVVNGGTGEGALELVSVSKVTHGNNGVRDGSTDVGSHDHIDGLADTNRSGSHKGDNDGGGCGRGLKKYGSEDANHEGRNRVGVLAEDLSGSASSDYLGGISKKIKAEEEEVEEENDSSEAN